MDLSPKTAYFSVGRSDWLRFWWWTVFPHVELKYHRNETIRDCVWSALSVLSWKTHVFSDLPPYLADILLKGKTGTDSNSVSLCKTSQWIEWAQPRDSPTSGFLGIHQKICLLGNTSVFIHVFVPSFSWIPTEPFVGETRGWFHSIPCLVFHKDTLFLSVPGSLFNMKSPR